MASAELATTSKPRVAISKGTPRILTPVTSCGLSGLLLRTACVDAVMVAFARVFYPQRRPWAAVPRVKHLLQCFGWLRAPSRRRGNVGCHFNDCQRLETHQCHIRQHRRWLNPSRTNAGLTLPAPAIAVANAAANYLAQLP